MGLTHSNREGVFFTVTAFIILSVLIIIITVGLNQQQIETGVSTAQITEHTRERIDLHYLPLILRYTAYDTLKALAQDSITNNRYIRLPADYAEAAMNGTYGWDSGGPPTFPVPSKRLPVAYNELALAITNAGIANLSITTQTTSVQQIGTFFGRATATVNYTLTSRDGSVRYNRTVGVTADFRLEGIPDPYFTRGSMSAGFPEQRNFTQFEWGVWNNTEFQRFWSNRSYITDTASPSIFNRIQRLGTSSPYGIFTLIPASVIIPSNRTSVDADYFRVANVPCRYYNITWAPNLRLGWIRAESFNLTGLQPVPQQSPLIICPPPPFS